MPGTCMSGHLTCNFLSFVMVLVLKTLLPSNILLYSCVAVCDYILVVTKLDVAIQNEFFWFDVFQYKGICKMSVKYVTRGHIFGIVSCRNSVCLTDSQERFLHIRRHTQVYCLPVSQLSDTVWGCFKDIVMTKKIHLCDLSVSCKQQWIEIRDITDTLIFLCWQMRKWEHKILP